MFKFTVSALLLAFAVVTSTAHDATSIDEERRELGFFRGNSRDLQITVMNLSYQQVMSPFFYMVHNGDAEPLFELGEEASPELANLAETGATDDLVNGLYNQETNGDVLSATALAGGLPPGNSVSFTVTINRNFPYVSFASMAVDTNDCFVGINSMFLHPGQRLMVPGYDAGSEENNELCNSIPGPQCAKISSENVRSENGEGFIHIHRGVHGIGDLNATSSDWRNPMLLVTVSSA